MARPRALTPENELRAAELRRAGMSLDKIGAELGVDRKSVQRAINSPSPATQALLGSGGGSSLSLSPEPSFFDAFETQQLKTLEVIRQAIQCPKKPLTANALAQLTKAQNDTIKALRAYRTGRPSDSQDSSETQQSAVRVRERLERLRDAKAPVALVKAEEEPEPAKIRKLA